MIEVAFRHAWMQKHPTPTTGGGDYHWHPASTPAEIRTALTERASRGGAAATSVWILGDGWLAWGRTFAAVAPSDRRRYTGIAATIATPAGDARGWAAALPEVLHRLQLAPAAPLEGDGPPDEAVALESKAAMQPIDPEAMPELLGDAARRDAFVRAALFGGPAAAPQPADPRLPSLVGSLLSWLPAAQRARPRGGSFVASPTDPAGAGSRGAGNLVHYLARAWCCSETIRARSPALPATAWQLVLDLAAARRVELPALFDELTRAAGAWDTAPNLARYLVDSGVLSDLDIQGCDRRAPRPLRDPDVPDAGWLWNRLLHYWGRGFFGPQDRDVAERLADLLAMRIAADHLFHLDAPDQTELPQRYLRRLRYESLLTRRRVGEMTEHLRRTLPSLEALRE